MPEKRRFLRFGTALSAICETVSEKWREASKIKNISKDGALLVLTKPLNAGCEIKLSMDVPGDNVPIFASCQVAWQKKPGRFHKDASYETGVKFTDMDNHNRARLLDYVYTLWLRLLDKE